MLFTFAKKKELERYARTLVVRRRDFVDMILACQQGQLPFRYGVHFRRSAPRDLPPVFKASSDGAGGRPELDPKKFLVVFNRLRHESWWAAAHLFYTPGFYEWHLFIFHHHDLDVEDDNHWTGGTHMHFVNWLWPRLDPERVWKEFMRTGKKPGSSLHLRHESGAA
jgi:hypothetical protein